MVGRALTLVAVLGITSPSLVSAQAARPGTPPARVTLHARNTTRVESWRFFEPNAGGGEPRYTFIANRLLATADVRMPHVDLAAGVQFVQFGNLPDRASGPGPLGTGPQYFDHAGSRHSRGVYLRTVNIRWTPPVAGLRVQAGRFGYASGGESPSGDAAIEAVKRLRVDSRLVGEFEWSIFQRSFDGVRGDFDRARWHATGTWLRPTQGGFEEQAGRSLRDVDIATASLSVKPGAILPHTDWQAFVVRYDDTRKVTGRPDNSGLAAARADVHVTSTGGTVVGVYPTRRGRIDVLGWVVRQGGDWYGQTHAASAVAVEVGHQWLRAPGQVWLRAGVLSSSGDSDPADARHETFFQVLPTGRKYSLSTISNLMNATDVFVQAVVKPVARVTVRGDVHRLTLTNAKDLWYAGSGATTRTGAVFGFAGRRSNGSTDLGTVTEASADWAVGPHLSINGYLGRVSGGRVVTGTFAGRVLRFGYVEAVVAF